MKQGDQSKTRACTFLCGSCRLPGHIRGRKGWGDPCLTEPLPCTCVLKIQGAAPYHYPGKCTPELTILLVRQSCERQAS